MGILVTTKALCRLVAVTVNTAPRLVQLGAQRVWVENARRATARA
jgi:hypothetical protein